jgi:hypothetical protein
MPSCRSKKLAINVFARTLKPQALRSFRPQLVEFLAKNGRPLLLNGISINRPFGTAIQRTARLEIA